MIVMVQTRTLFPALGLLVAANAAAAPKVEELYQQNCAGCHGADLRGGSGSSLVDGVWKHGESDAAIAAIIADGAPDMGMPAMKGALAPEQIRSLVVFIREREAAAVREKKPAPKPDAQRVVESKRARFRLETIADGLDNPWGVAAAADGRLFLTEKAGRLFVIGADGKKSAPIRNLPASVQHGQGGLMDVALHPDFKDNGWIYLAVNEGEKKDGRTRCITGIVRGKIIDGAWTDAQRIWSAPEEFRTDNGVHFGSRIVFDGKGHVFFVVGERGRDHNRGAQDLGTPYGKIFRLHDDGRVPKDNPFAKDAKAIPGLWTYGHRNPQGMAFHPVTGDLYATEHGPRGGDELNLISPGNNYGWPVVTDGIRYDGKPWGDGKTERADITRPVVTWTPSIAACGTTFVTGDRFPAWKNDALVGALAGQEVRRVRLENRRVVEQETLFRGLGRVRDVKCAPDGSILVVFNSPDRLVRLVPAEDKAAAVKPR